jgi:Carboxypeptidase regulatory-like domain
VHARPVVTVQREVVTVQAPAVQCPTVAIAKDASSETETEDDPDAIEIADTAAVRQLDTEAKRRAALEMNIGARGALFGIARDAKTGEVLAGVTVVATARGSSQTAITDEIGYYQITDLDPDTYTVTFYYADATIEHGDVAVAARKSTPVYTKFDTSMSDHAHQGITIDTNYTRNIPVTRHFEDLEGVSFSSGSTIENEYIVVE